MGNEGKVCLISQGPIAIPQALDISTPWQMLTDFADDLGGNCTQVVHSVELRTTLEAGFGAFLDHCW